MSCTGRVMLCVVAVGLIVAFGRQAHAQGPQSATPQQIEIRYEEPSIPACAFTMKH